MELTCGITVFSAETFTYWFHCTSYCIDLYFVNLSCFSSVTHQPAHVKDERRKAVVAHDTNVCAEFTDTTDIVWTAVGRGVLHCSDPGPWTQRHVVLQTFLHTPYKKKTKNRICQHTFFSVFFCKRRTRRERTKRGTRETRKSWPSWRDWYSFCTCNKGKRLQNISVSQCRGKPLPYIQTHASSLFFPNTTTKLKQKRTGGKDHIALADNVLLHHCQAIQRWPSVYIWVRGWRKMICGIHCCGQVFTEDLIGSGGCSHKEFTQSQHFY